MGYIEEEIKLRNTSTDAIVLLKTLKEINFHKFIAYRKLQRYYVNKHDDDLVVSLTPEEVKTLKGEIIEVINKICGWVQLLLDSKLKQTQKEFFEDIEELVKDISKDTEESMETFQKLLDTTREYKKLCEG